MKEKNNVKFFMIHILCMLFLFIHSGFGQEFADDNKKDNIRSNKIRISDKELDKKREGDYFTVFPGPGYSPDLGFILAALVGYYNNGKRNDMYFAYAPYKHALTLLLSWSTKGMYSILADWDAPYFKQTHYRVRARLWFMRNLTEVYFGTGEASLQKLTTPEGRIYSKFSHYFDDLLLIEDSETDAYYNFYLNEYLLCNLNVERDILGGLYRIAGGISASKVWIHDYTGENVPAKKNPNASKRVEAPMRQTKLREDYLAGQIIGFNGGWNNNLRLGLAYDTRDLESNPRNGMFHDIFFILSDNVIGSKFDYSVTTFTTRFFYSPLQKYLDLIMAARLTYSVKTGCIPFFVMNYIPTTDKHIYGLGGEYTIRGFRLSRFTGPIMAFGNFEMRYVFTAFKIREQLIELMLVPFIDYGRVYDNVKHSTLNNMKYAYGIGLRSGINQSFVLSFDFGFSEEEQMVFYMTFGNIF